MDEQMTMQMPLSRSALEEDFWAFHHAHREVYRYIRDFAIRWRTAQGPAAKMGIAMLFERVRWEIGITGSDTPQLNNNHRAYYARLLMSVNPELKGMFHLRQQRVQATMGPENAELEPNVHVGPGEETRHG